MLTPLGNITAIFVGDRHAGKTSLILTITTNAMPGEYLPEVSDIWTANVMYTSDVRVVKGNTVYSSDPYSVTLVDTCVNEALRVGFYKEADVVFVCYSVVDRETFLHVPQWMEEVRGYTQVGVVLVGMKEDCEEIVVSVEEGEEMGGAIGAEISMRTGLLSRCGLTDVFQNAISVGLGLNKKNERREPRCVLL